MFAFSYLIEMRVCVCHRNIYVSVCVFIVFDRNARVCVCVCLCAIENMCVSVCVCVSL